MKQRTWRSLSTQMAMAGLLAVFATSAFGSTFSTSHIGSDATYTAMVGGPTEPLLNWVAEGRIGSTGDSNKANIGHSTGAPAQTANPVWQNGIGKDWTISYNAVNYQAMFSIGGYNLSYTVNPTSSLQLFIRTAAIGYSAGTSLSALVNNLNFTQGSQTGAVGDTAFANNPTNASSVVDYLSISGVDYSQSFTLAGTTTFSWGSATPPTGSRLAFEVKLTQTTATPEPTTFLLLGTALVAGAFYGLRRRKALAAQPVRAR